MSPADNVLLIRTDRIGDLVLTSPAVKVIKENIPGCSVSFYLKEYTSSLLADNQQIDNLIISAQIKNLLDFFDEVRRIRKYKFSAAVLFSPSLLNSLLVFFAGIPVRIGTGYRWYSFFFNRRVFEHRKTAEKHELVYNLNLLKPLGIEKPEIDSLYEYSGLSLKAGSTTEIRNLLLSSGWDEKKATLCFHPGSGGSAVDLPEEKMKQLISNCADLNCNIILTGSEAETDLCQRLKTNDSIINLSGTATISELLAAISFCDILVANSTGPIHLAAALNKFVVGFYPKIIQCSPERWGPYTEKKTIFMPEIECSNCTRKQCEELNCMNSINIDRVHESIKKLVFQLNMGR